MTRQECARSCTAISSFSFAAIALRRWRCNFRKKISEPRLVWREDNVRGGMIYALPFKTVSGPAKKQFALSMFLLFCVPRREQEEHRQQGPSERRLCKSNYAVEWSARGNREERDVLEWFNATAQKVREKSEIGSIIVVFLREVFHQALVLRAQNLFFFLLATFNYNWLERARRGFLMNWWAREMKLKRIPDTFAKLKIQRRHRVMQLRQPGRARQLAHRLAAPLTHRLIRREGIWDYKRNIYPFDAVQ